MRRNIPPSMGRVDYMPRLKRWRAIVYIGRRDVKSGDYLTQGEAWKAVRFYYKEFVKKPSRRNPVAESIGGKLATDIIGGIGFGIGAGITERYILGKGRKNPGRRRTKKNIFVWNNSPAGVEQLARSFAEGATSGKAGSLYIHGDTLYSYGPHFPVAKRTGTKTMVVTSRKAPSRTTAKQIGQVIRGIEGAGFGIHRLYMEPEAAGSAGYSNPCRRRTKKNIFVWNNVRRGEKRLWRVPVRYTSSDTGRMVRDIFFMTATSAAEAKEAAYDTIRHDGLEPGEVGRPQRLKSNPKGSRGRYARERVAALGKFAKGSLRTAVRGKHRIVVGCPVGKYSRKAKRCRVGTRAQSILHPMSEAFRLTRAGRKITVGRGPTERRITRRVARRKIAANPQEGEYNYIVIGWSRDPNIGRAQLAGYDGTLRFKKRADAIKLAKAQLKGVYDRTWVESVVYHRKTGWTSFDIIWDERKSGNPGKRRVRCNPKNCNNPRHKHNPLLQTVMLANGNSRRRTMTTRTVRTTKRATVGNPCRAPFKQGQRIPIEKARAWVRRSGNPELIRQFAEAEQLQVKANKRPRYVTWSLLPIGSKDKIDAVTAMVQYGTSPETMYRPPKGSKKGKSMYRHEWGDGSGRPKPVPVLATPGGGAMVMPLGEGQVIDDWMRG